MKAKHTRSAVWEETHNPGLVRQKVAVVINPIKSRSAEARVLVESACLAAGWEAPRFFETTAEDHGFSQARAAVEYGADVVLVGGGDGTVRVVADVLAHTDIAMGLLPLGTGNLLARNVHLDIGDLHGCVEIALFGHQRFIDTARMRVENAHGETIEPDRLHLFALLPEPPPCVAGLHQLPSPEDAVRRGQAQM